MHPIIAEMLATARQQDIQRSARAARISQVSRPDPARRRLSLQRRVGRTESPVATGL